MMAVTGAVRTFSTLVGESAGMSRCRASGVRRKRMRAGLPLALVGPHFIQSYKRRSVSSLTGWSSQEENERAVRNSWSSASALRAAMAGMGCSALDDIGPPREMILEPELVQELRFFRAQVLAVHDPDLETIRRTRRPQVWPAGAMARAEGGGGG